MKKSSTNEIHRAGAVAHSIYYFFAVLFGLLVSTFWPAWAHTVFAVGGGSPSVAIDAEMVKAVGPGGRLCVISDAADNPEMAASRVLRRFRALGLAPLAIDPASVSREKCDGLYIAGGEQKRLVEKFGLNEPRSQVVSNLRRAILEDGVVAIGSSAGTAVLSNPMIVNERNDGPGLGVSPVLLDQHFLARKRLPRLIEFMQRSGRMMGVGVDEGAAMVFKSQKPWRVLGPGSVVVIEKIQKKDNSYLLSWLHAGDSYDQETGQFTSASERFPRIFDHLTLSRVTQPDSSVPERDLVHLLRQIADNKVDGTIDLVFLQSAKKKAGASLCKFSFSVNNGTQIFGDRDEVNPTIIRLAMAVDTTHALSSAGLCVSK